MYKVLVLKNRVKVNIEDDFSKAKDYVKRHHDFEVDFEFKDIDVPVSAKMWKTYTDGRLLFGTDNIKDRIRPLIEENKYHCVIFAWNEEESPIHNLEQQFPNKFLITSWTHWSPLYPNTQHIDLVTSKADDRIDWIYKSIIHELYHAFVKSANSRGANILDVMDMTEVNGKKIAYYKNDSPEAEDGNFAIQRNILEQHTDKILYQKEPKKKYKYFTDNEIKGLKEELVVLLDELRGRCGFPFIISSGLRSKKQNEKVGGVEDSAHLKGLAVDLHIETSDKRFKLIDEALKMGVNRIGIGKDFCHIDIDPDKPKNVIWHYY